MVDDYHNFSKDCNALQTTGWKAERSIIGQLSTLGTNKCYCLKTVSETLIKLICILNKCIEKAEQIHVLQMLKRYSTVLIINTK